MSAPYSAFLSASCAPAALAPAWAAILEGVAEANAVLRSYWRQTLQHRSKADGSPVSEADEAANAVLTACLAKATPEIPVISEEGILPAAGWNAPVFWLLDPLDGTKAFLRGEGEFVISLGLVVDGRAVGGVIAAPAWKSEPITAWGMHGQGAWQQQGEQIAQSLQARHVAVQQIDAVGVDLLVAYRGRTPEVDGFLAPLKEHRRIPCSSALKFLQLAMGDADLYPRFGPTHQWDTAGGEGLLRAAGGEMSRMDGAPMHYGQHPKTAWLNTGFLATGAGGHVALAAAGVAIPAVKEGVFSHA